MNIKKIVLLLLAINAVLVLIPAIVFNLPIVQTDGASHYVYAKVYSETFSLDSENPEYNRMGSVEKKLSDYPPFVTIVFGSIIKMFGNDIFLINGGFGLAFFLLASIFMYIFIKDITKNNTVAIIGLAFFILNIRAYYTLFTGIYPAFVSFCLSIPALYFSYKFFLSGNNRNLVLSLLFTCMTVFAYTIQGLYLIFLEIMLWFGIKLEEKLSVHFPKINARIKRISLSDFKNAIYLLIPTALFLFFVIISFTLKGTTRETWLSGWFSGLMSTCTGYQCVWKHFFIVEGLIALFAIFGSIYLFYKKDWKIITLLLGGFLIVISGSIFIEGEPTILVYIYRFYTTFSALLVIPASVFIYKIISMKEVRNIGIVFLALCIFIQLAILGYFYLNIGPAITQGEYDAASFLSGHTKSNILYVNNEVDEGTFRSFKWVVVFAKSEKYSVSESVGNLTGFDYVFVQDKDKLSADEKNKLGNNIAFNSGNAQVYKIA
ncbi:MAG: hypothetical protein V1900_00800 [Candidatus Aenigmatarchaeota archaeon]